MIILKFTSRNSIYTIPELFFQIICILLHLRSKYVHVNMKFKVLKSRNRRHLTWVVVGCLNASNPCSWGHETYCDYTFWICSLSAALLICNKSYLLKFVKIRCVTNLSVASACLMNLLSGNDEVTEIYVCQFSKWITLPFKCNKML